MSNRSIALAAAFTLLTIALLLMQANTVSTGARNDMAPATAPGAEPVPFTPRAAP